jgi:ribonuclease VapC
MSTIATPTICCTTNTEFRGNDKLALRVVAFGTDEACEARRAYVTFGKGRHPAQLNFGDCMSYAVAKTTGEPLLYKGDDFSQTDIPAAA